MGKELDWLLLGRYALLIALCDLIPIPFLDRMVENRLRRRLVDAIGRRHGRELPAADLAVLGDAPPGGCTGCLTAILLWPIRKVLKTALVVFQVKGIADRFSELVHRGLLLEDAFDEGWLPGDAARVRAAMDGALTHVDTRPIERTLMGVLRSYRHDLNRTIWETVRVLRLRHVDALADAATADRLAESTTRASKALVAALRSGRVLVPELVAWFRAEMGVKLLDDRLPGPIDPEVLAPDGPAPPDPALPAPVEDAVEVGADDVPAGSGDRGGGG
jgi:hypothetical protein